MKIAWKYIKKEIILLFLSTFFMVFFEAGIIFLSAKMTQSIFDAIQIELEKYYLFFLYYLLGIVGFLILDFISVWFYYLSFNKIHFMILNGVSSIIFDQYRRTTNKTFLQYDPTNIYTLLTKDANMYLNYNIFTLNNIFHIVLNVVFSIIVGAAFSWILIIFILIVISFSFIGSFLFKKTQRNAFDKYSEANHQFQTKINNLLDGYSRLYFANKQNLLNEQLSSEINSVYETSLKKNNIVSFVQLGSQRIYEFIGGALIIGSAILIFHFSNQSTFLGVIDIAFLTLITAFVGRLKSFGPNLLASIKNYLSNRNIVKKFNLNLEPETNASTIERVENIKLLNLDFKYPESDKKLFQNLNLDLKKGQKYAIIGESGSGKSTLLKLLNGSYEPDKGQVLVNGQNINAIKSSSLRKHLTFIDSKNLVFPTNIANNVTFYEKNFDQAKLEYALDKVNLLDELKDNYLNSEFDVTNNLSLGQKQRLVLARLFYLDKKWIVLDESLSNLDDQNSTDIQGKIINDPDLTLVLVTHHLKKENHHLFNQIINLDQITNL